MAPLPPPGYAYAVTTSAHDNFNPSERMLSVIFVLPFSAGKNTFNERTVLFRNQGMVVKVTNKIEFTTSRRPCLFASALHQNSEKNTFQFLRVVVFKTFSNEFKCGLGKRIVLVYNTSCFKRKHPLFNYVCPTYLTKRDISTFENCFLCSGLLELKIHVLLVFTINGIFPRCLGGWSQKMEGLGFCIEAFNMDSFSALTVFVFKTLYVLPNMSC